MAQAGLGSIIYYFRSRFRVPRASRNRAGLFKFTVDSHTGVDYFNPVDGDEVPVPHFGIQLSVPQWRDLAARLEKAGVDFVIPPTLRFEGAPGEQYTMFFKDPSGNNLEFKAMTTRENLFAKYNVAAG